MVKELTLTLHPKDCLNGEIHLLQAAKSLGVESNRIRHLKVLRSSIDARKGAPRVHLRCHVWLDEDYLPTPPFALDIKDVHSAPEVVIVGFGPAGMFAALRFIELGIKPVIFERGKAVRERRRDIAQLNKYGLVNPESNYCFGEGGAGTFSDGKLYTRSHKRGSIERILNILVLHGASPEILVQSHPHVGTNKLPGVVQAIRETIQEAGGEIHFNSCVNELLRENSRIAGIRTTSGEARRASATILATGHSARDVYRLCLHAGIEIETKPFALGVRIEHPQSLVDSQQYRCEKRPDWLPAAAYELRAQTDGRGVFSFCMCPGGIICPASTEQDLVVVNGWSPSKRNSRFANSGIVVEVKPQDYQEFSASKQALAGMEFQAKIERRAAIAGGGSQRAPAQRITDFLAKRSSTTLPPCSYLPGVEPQNLWDVLPNTYASALQQALAQFDSRLRGYISEEAIMVGIESRTSSPVRIPRNPLSLEHPFAPGLFPCAEGAGYAGGIVSAAMDGERIATAVAAALQSVR